MLPLLILRDAGIAANASSLTLTDTTKIQLPINCVLIGNQPLSEGERTEELWNPSLRTKTKILNSGLTQLSKDGPSFTVTKRGLRQ